VKTWSGIIKLWKGQGRKERRWRGRDRIWMVRWSHLKETVLLMWKGWNRTKVKKGLRERRK